MNLKMKYPFFILVSLASFFSACNPARAAQPTLDIDEIRTQAVQTAIMEITVQAALHPSASPVPTNTISLPTATIGTAVPVTSSAGSGGGSSGGSSGSSGTPIPTRTPDVYICEVVTQNPLDKPQMTGGNYDMVWTIHNVGAATWNTSEYYIKWLGGSDLSPNHTYPLAKNVAPFETVNIVVDIRIPINPTSELQVTRWGIVNDNGDVFCKFFHAIPSTYPAPIKTPTAKP